MPTLGGGIAHWNNIDDSGWEHGRMKVANLSVDSPSHEPGVIIDYIQCFAEGKSKGTVLLVHSFPQTSYQFRRVITPISSKGYNVIVHNYRGDGASSKPWNGYTKKEMKKDLHTFVHKLEVKDKVHVVGYDIGRSQYETKMLHRTYSIRRQHDRPRLRCAVPQRHRQRRPGECPIPGTEFYDTTKHTLPIWHFTFHDIPDLPEALVEGKERLYFKHFFDPLTQNPDATSAYDLDAYTNAYSAPDAMRAGFNVFWTFEQDAVDNRELLQEHGKCKVPCLALWGAQSFANEEQALKMCNKFYESAEFTSVTACGHCIAEEKPGGLVEALTKWFEKN